MSQAVSFCNLRHPRRRTIGVVGAAPIVPYRRSAGGSNLAVYYVTMSPGQDPTQLSASTPNVVEDPVLSPDGSLVAFLQTGTIRTINPDGSNEQVILTGGGYPSLQWKPDGTNLIFESRAGGDEHKIFTCYPDGSNKTQIYADPSTRTIYYPKYNYDGTRIAFLVLLSSTSWGLWTANADGASAAQIATIPTQFSVARSYAWANNQSVIAYCNWGATGQIYRIDDDGTNQTQLAAVPNYNVHPRCWSPDDSYLYYMSSNSGVGDLRKAATDGSGTSLVYSSFNGDLVLFIFGERLYATNPSAGLQSVLLDGSGYRLEDASTSVQLETL